MSPVWKWPRRKRQEEKRQGSSFTGTTGDQLHFSLTGHNGHSTLVVMCPDGHAFTFPGDHPNFLPAKALAIEGGERDSEEYRKLFDVEDSIRNLFGVVTDRVRVDQGVVYFDEKPIHNVATERILTFMDEGTRDFAPIAKFLENVEDNPNEASKDALFEWLEANSLAIDAEGFIVCFKGVGDDYTPSRQGPGIVNGVDLGDNATIHYAPGNLVAIAREKCDETAAHCSTGLHVANRNFADSFNGTPKTMEVRVNPRDVVSVRLDGREKIRCCRLRVIGEAPPAENFNKALWLGV